VMFIFTLNYLHGKFHVAVCRVSEESLLKLKLNIFSGHYCFIFLEINQTLKRLVNISIITHISV
jgi:hypothetical protein